MIQYCFLHFPPLIIYFDFGTPIMKSAIIKNNIKTEPKAKKKKKKKKHQKKKKKKKKHPKKTVSQSGFLTSLGILLYVFRSLQLWL